MKDEASPLVKRQGFKMKVVEMAGVAIKRFPQKFRSI